MVSRLERPRAAVCDRFLYATFKTARFADFFFSYAPSGDAIPSRRGQPCVKRMVVVSFEKHDLHMLAASWPAGFAVLRVGGCHIRSGWEWSRCLGAEPEGHLDATARCRRSSHPEPYERFSMLPIGPGVVPCQCSKDLKSWSVLLDVRRLSAPCRRWFSVRRSTPASCLNVECCSI